MLLYVEDYLEQARPRLLQNDPMVQALWFRGLNDVDAHWLSKALRHNSAVRRLILERPVWTTRGLHDLCGALPLGLYQLRIFALHSSPTLVLQAHLPQIRELCLTNACFSTPEACAALQTCLQNSKWLEELDLRDTLVECPDDFQRALTAGLRHHRSLRTLHLCCHNRPRLSWAALVSASRHLQTLNLSSNGMDSVAAQALAQALKTTSSLESLDLSWNDIGNAGWTALCHALMDNTTSLKRLCLNGNQRISSPGLLSLAVSLPHMKGLRELHLESIGVVLPETLQAVAWGLSQNVHLEELHLDCHLPVMEEWLELNRAHCRTTPLPHGLMPQAMAYQTPNVIYHMLQQNTTLLQQGAKQQPSLSRKRQRCVEEDLFTTPTSSPLSSRRCIRTTQKENGESLPPSPRSVAIL